MKTQLKMTLVASAVAAVISGPAMAMGGDYVDYVNNDYGDQYEQDIDRDVSIDVDKNINTDVNTDVAVDHDINIDKNIDVDKNVDVEKNVAVNKTHNEMERVDRVLRDIAINASAGATANDRQINQGNTVDNLGVTNDAFISDNVGNGASGNIGMNVAAGDTNVQDNAAALAAVDAGFVFGESYSEVNVAQTNTDNETMNEGVINGANVQQSAFANASGNIGVNVASGTGNAQKNTMAASVSTARMASASLNSNQESYDNNIRNEGRVAEYTETTAVTLSGTGTYTGSGSGQMSADITGSMDQIGDVYPDQWDDAPHPNGDADGHFDLDTATQGGSDLNDDGGALAFGASDMEANGSIGFRERGTIDLAGVSGEVATTRYVVVNAENNAFLSDSAFSNASGNIGVNVASGTGNLQSNSLSMAVACNTCVGGSAGNGGGEQ
ncbi:hypothetical protein [Guyparkeria halopsychrophila]|uniref:hypothetical protein n=1 Tax=Guyparkeria halopsychrophila TaxID=3139421 RepID=UPI0037C9F532